MNPTQESMAVAAQLWCLPQHAKKEMDAEFAVSIAVALDLAVREERKNCADTVEKFLEESATHILHYHDKEGRTTKERVFHEARFKEIVETIRQRGEGV